MTKEGHDGQREFDLKDALLHAGVREGAISREGPMGALKEIAIEAQELKTLIFGLAEKKSRLLTELADARTKQDDIAAGLVQEDLDRIDVLEQKLQADTVATLRILQNFQTEINAFMATDSKGQN